MNGFKILCPECYSVPQIRIIDETSCSINCLSCNYEHNYLLSDYITLLNKMNGNHPCEQNFFHHNREINNGIEYCCKCQKWLCASCISSHNKSKKSHKTNKVCHLCKNDTFSQKSDYYCFDCKFHFCKLCKSNHIKHKFTTISEIIDKDDYFIYHNKMMSAIYYIDTLEDIKTNTVNYLTDQIKLIEKAYIENKRLNDTIISLCKIIYRSFNDTTPNYYAAMNIINNNVMLCYVFQSI